MALVIGEKQTRTVPCTATEVIDGDKPIEHKFNVTIEIMDPDEFKTMTERWAELQRMSLLNPEKMSEDDVKEGRKTILEHAEPFIKDISPLLDADNKPLEFDKLKSRLLKLAHLKVPLTDVFMAVQNGVTVKEYRRMKEKNS